MLIAISVGLFTALALSLILFIIVYLGLLTATPVSITGIATIILFILGEYAGYLITKRTRPRYWRRYW